MALLSEMREVKLETDFSYNAGISACEKGKQWQRGLALLSEMRESRLDPTVISYNAGMSACARCGPWQQALLLLSEAWESSLEPNEIISYSAVISACEKGEQWQRALALLGELWVARLEPNSNLQRGNQRVRDGQAVAASFDVAQRDAGGEAGARRPLVSYSAGISACEKGEQWQEALALLSGMREAKLEPNVISPTSCNAGVSACEKGDQWQRALALLCEMREARLEPDVIFSYSAGISACEKGDQWQRALALLSKMRGAKLEPNSVTTLGSARARRAISGSGLWRCSARCGRRSSSPTASLQLQCWDQRVREGQAVATGPGAAQRDVGGEAGSRRVSPTTQGSVRARKAGSGSGLCCCSARCGRRSRNPTPSQLQRWDQRVRKRRAVAAGAGSAERGAGSRAGAQRRLS
ncbi:unnamed protein product [Prorocentrum cordatum]|uniref:Pentatricopeptide repeat-containing protein, chloroplastic n=1 Tax=Prorocentrum cordatum TaxID=2364126 RepID=A0ABN9XML9_9DINO|nr:unnamed protein product [Polarella glacialis]